MKKFYILFVPFILFACENTLENSENAQAFVDESSIEISEEQENESEENGEKKFESTVDFAKFYLTQLEEMNLEALEKYSEEEILFSPYAYIDIKTAKRVGVSTLASNDDKPQFWGFYVGRGDSILLNYSDYLKQFVFNFDWRSKNIEINTFQNENPTTYGSESHNVQKLFPNSRLIEFYQPPSEPGFMDWNALILLVNIVNEEYRVKGLIHNQWTP